VLCVHTKTGDYDYTRAGLVSVSEAMGEPRYGSRTLLTQGDRFESRLDFSFPARDDGETTAALCLVRVSDGARFSFFTGGRRVKRRGTQLHFEEMIVHLDRADTPIGVQLSKEEQAALRPTLEPLFHALTNCATNIGKKRRAVEDLEHVATARRRIDDEEQKAQAVLTQIADEGVKDDKMIDEYFV